MLGSRVPNLNARQLQDNLVVSGDKKGQVAVWDFEKVHERTVYASMHRALTNNLRFLGPLHDVSCASASSDGLLKARCKLALDLHGLPAPSPCAEEPRQARSGTALYSFLLLNICMLHCPSLQLLDFRHLLLGQTATTIP